MPFTSATASYSGSLLDTNFYANEGNIFLSASNNYNYSGNLNPLDFSYSEAKVFLEASPSYVYTGTLEILNYCQEIIVGPSSHPARRPTL